MKRLLIWVFISLTPLYADGGKEKEPLRISAVGDSITWGFGLENRRDNSWPGVLENLASGSLEVGNFGRNGANLTERGDRPYRETLPYARAVDFDGSIVVIALGTNDTKIGNRIFLDTFKEDYLSLIESFRQGEKDREIYLCLPPPLFDNRWGMEENLLEKCLIPLIGEIAGEADCEVIDLYHPLLDRTEFFPDGVHPDVRGARIIGEVIYNVLSESSQKFNLR